jgi:cell division GTPase FtsZ
MSENQENIQDVNQYFGAEGIDVMVPDIPLPPEPEEKKEVKDEVEGAFKFAFVGAGQGGSRIAESFHKLGYRKIGVINTAQQDLNSINVENKLCIGSGGAGKDRAVAAKCFEEKRDDVLDFMRRSFGEDVDRIFVCAGAGGGSGAGTLVPLVKTAQELQETVKSGSKKVGVILALPKYSEGRKVNSNAYETLKEACALVDQGIVSPLVIIDNEKTSKLYSNVSVSNFWQTANMSTAGVFHLFNMTASRDSSYSSFDSSDYKSVLDSGITIFGATPVPQWDDPVSISRAVRGIAQSGSMSGGIDISTANVAGAILIGGKEVLDKIPQSNLDQAFDQLSRILRSGSMVHRGIYSGDKDNLTVFTTIGGIATPQEKLNELMKLGDLTNQTDPQEDTPDKA